MRNKCICFDFMYFSPANKYNEKLKAITGIIVYVISDTAEANKR